MLKLLSPFGFKMNIVRTPPGRYDIYNRWWKYEKKSVWFYKKKVKE